MFQNFLQELPMYLLSLPVILMALSVHESAHGWMAYKLGDPTARNLGRITLNPVKHFDLFGFICMVLVHFGWAKPVPIVTRNFKKPRRDMALTGAAGPVSNILLAIIHFLALRIALIFITPAFSAECDRFYQSPETFAGSMGFTVVALILYILYLGVIINLTLAVFNLIPIPPFDGSRIFYAFLPPKWYFGIMKYERYIMLGFFIFIILFDSALNFIGDITWWIFDALLGLTGTTGHEWNVFVDMFNYVSHLFVRG